VVKKPPQLGHLLLPLPWQPALADQTEGGDFTYHLLPIPWPLPPNTGTHNQIPTNGQSNVASVVGWWVMGPVGSQEGKWGQWEKGTGKNG
jgi:hypothetical protein